MKKLTALLTSAVMSLGTLTAFSFVGTDTYAEAIVVSDNFEVSYDGWTNRGDLTELTACAEAGHDSLRGMNVTNRQSTEDGAYSEKGFYLDGGVTYDYSVFVRSDSTETFNLSLRWLYPDGETYEFEQIGSVTVQAGEWTELSAKYAAPNDTVNLTLSITTDSTADFSFDNVSVTQTVKSYTNTVNAATQSVGLKDIYANQFRVGTIFNGSTINNSTMKALVLKEYNSISCENEMKPNATLVANGSTNTNIKVSLSQAAAILDFCSKNNIGVRGHVLVWHAQTPTWFFMDNFQNSGTPVSKAVMEQRLESYIKNLFSAIKTQYPDLNLYAYDVVNEAVSDDASRTSVASGLNGARPGGFEAGVVAPGSTSGGSPWTYVYGDNSFIERAFTYAAKYRDQYYPEMKLFYNDYNEWWDHKRDCIIRTILTPLYNKGILDGMGMQMHINSDLNAWASSVDGIKTALNMYKSVGDGIQIQMTELDVSTEKGKFTAQQQADKYKAVFQAAMDVNNSGSGGKVTAICIWAPNDSNTWLGSENAPALFDGNNQKKAAYNAVASIVPQSEWGDGNNPGFEGGGNTNIEPDENGYFFHSTFEGDTDSWSGRGDASILTSGRTAYAGNESLLVQERTAAWNGAARSLNARAFVPGSEFSFSANVMYFDGSATDTFYMKLQYTDASGETQYSTVAEADALKGEWVQLKNTNYKIPSDATNMQLYIETADSTNNFYIDEAIGAVGGTVIDGAGDSVKIIIGDVNSDGIIDALDLSTARNGIVNGFDNPTSKLAADVDQSGTVDADDLKLLQDFILGKINKFPTGGTVEPIVTTAATTKPVITTTTTSSGGPNTSATMYANFRSGQSSYFEASDGWSNGDCFDCVWRGTNATFSDNALNLKIDKDSSGTYQYSGAEYRTKDFYHYGYYETSMQAIKNDGVVSSFFTYTGPSDNNPWDEIDIEILGKDTTKVQLNYYTNGVGNHEYMYDLGFDASLGYHTYGFDWQPNSITWYVDGKKVYTATSNIPKTPGKIMMNVWPGIGVNEWLKAYDGKTPLTAKYEWVTYNQN